MLKPKQQKKCRICKELFSPFNTLEKMCVPCAIKKGRENNRKEFDRETRRLKQKVKTRGEWLKEAQSAFNKYIRARDIDQPCISCSRTHSGQYHAGHYKSVGANPELRFDESNCHKQCAPCNNHLSGNISNYRVHLLAKIGLDGVVLLEGPHEPLKLTIDEIKAIKEKYNGKYKQLIKDQE